MGAEPTLDTSVSAVNHRLYFKYSVPWPFPIWLIGPQTFPLWKKLHNFNTLGHPWVCKYSPILRRTSVIFFNPIPVLPAIAGENHKIRGNGFTIKST